MTCSAGPSSTTPPSARPTALWACVDAVAVAVVCGGAIAAQTEPMALSKTGDAHVEATVQVPQSCASPTILALASPRGDATLGGGPGSLIAAAGAILAISLAGLAFVLYGRR